MCSHWTPTWFLDNWPDKRIILASYGATFAQEWGRKVRNTVEAHQAQLSVSLAIDSKSASNWKTPEEGGMMTAGVGGQITGRGFDLGIIDDPYKNWVDAMSPVYRNMVWQWWQSTFRTRAEPGASIIILMTRWHHEDLVSRLLAQDAEGTGENWRVIEMPALAKEDDHLGRDEGQPLWPERYDEEALEVMKRTFSEEVWLSLYQQTPLSESKVGRVYKGFTTKSVKEDINFDPFKPLCVSMDFNVNPMAWVYFQVDESWSRFSVLTGQANLVINVLGELCYPDSSTPEMCQVLLEKLMDFRKMTGQMDLQVNVYGDAAGFQRATVGVGASRTDYEIIRVFFAQRQGYDVRMNVPRANPAIRDRVNSMNQMLCNAAGGRNLFVDQSCVSLIKDFEKVKYKKDAGGNTTGLVDKTSDPSLTHLSDALGYGVWSIAGIKQGASEEGGLAQ